MPSARQITWAKIRVVFVTVAALSILSVLAFLLTGGTLFQPKSTLYLYIPDASGLASGSLVRVGGIDVGKVDSVVLSGLNQPDRVVKLTLQIQAQYLRSIPEGSYAQIETATAIGDKFINITRGTGATPTPPNATLPFRAQPELLQTIDLEQFTKQLQAVNTLLDEIEQGKNPTGQLLLTDDLWNSVRGQIAGFARDIDNLRKPGNPIGKLLYSDEDYRRIHDRVLDFDRTLAAFESGQSSVGQKLATDALYTQLLTNLKGLRGSLQHLGSTPLIQSDGTYAQWNRALESLIKTVDQIEVNPLLSTSETYDNLTGFAAQLTDQVRDFRQDPQKYLWVKIF
ncbi:MAG TPA: MlaD family protein [Bryobacteraceae bacterium]|jgi:phospholipid/cholesterol/gamma-HCH transport system substrate-binding protein